MDFTDGIWFGLAAVAAAYWMVRRWKRYGLKPWEGWRGDDAKWW
jgi:hypothetical protein